MSKNKLVILITGASSGIGRASADFFHSLGHQVIGLSRSKPQLPYNFAFYPLDVNDEEGIKTTLGKIHDDFGRIDVLINCAGIGVSGPLEETSLAQAKKIIDVNVFGALAMSKYALPYLRETKGIIFNIGSVAGPITIPFQTLYSMSKAALQSLSEGLRLEVKPHRVRVVSILPGDTKSSFTARREKVTASALYEPRATRSVAVMEKDERNGKDPLTVARAIKRLLYRKHPPINVTVGFAYKVLVLLSRILPRRLTQAIIYSIYGK
ncbi:MAG TPA: SDR family oxidoreductase [Bacilli bacterium]|nr:SDR family oxidoreductase [Bacilli bacterium]